MMLWQLHNFSWTGGEPWPTTVVVSTNDHDDVLAKMLLSEMQSELIVTPSPMMDEETESNV